MGIEQMADRYRVEVVKIPDDDSGAAALAKRLNSIGYNEQVMSITPCAKTGGWTTSYVLVIGPLLSLC
jgi:hypothetical protein